MSKKNHRNVSYVRQPYARRKQPQHQPVDHGHVSWLNVVHGVFPLLFRSSFLLILDVCQVSWCLLIARPDHFLTTNFIRHCFDRYHQLWIAFLFFFFVLTFSTFILSIFYEALNGNVVIRKVNLRKFLIHNNNNNNIVYMFSFDIIDNLFTQYWKIRMQNPCLFFYQKVLQCVLKLDKKIWLWWYIYVITHIVSNNNKKILFFQLDLKMFSTNFHMY